jgi:hypothetical protein
MKDAVVTDVRQTANVRDVTHGFAAFLEPRAQN